LNDRARQMNTLLRCPSDVLNIPNPHKGNSEGELKHDSDSGDDGQRAVRRRSGPMSVGAALEDAVATRGRARWRQ
jgi:hypothetical protein